MGHAICAGKVCDYTPYLEPDQYGLAVGIDLGSARCGPFAEVRILGFHLDTRLR